MSDPRLPNDHLQERVLIPFEHAQLTAGWGRAFFSPALRNFRLRGGKYRNPTGLAAHADNWFTGKIMRCGAADALVVADDTFTTTHAANTLTAVAHGLLTGDGPIRVSNAGGALPAGLVAATDYYVIKVDADTLSLASTRANAFISTAVDLTDDGTGTHTLSDTASTRRPVVAATIFDTDTTGATLAADAFVAMVLSATDANAVFAAGDDMWFVATEGGTATLPAGYGFVEGLYT
jgi:hypothetical protein